MRPAVRRATLTVVAAIALTPAFLMMGIRGEIRDPENSRLVTVSMTYGVMALYFLPATALSGVGGAVLLQWFARKPGVVRGITLMSTFSTLMALAVAVLLAFASFGYVPLVQDATPYIAWAAVAGLIEAAVLVITTRFDTALNGRKQ